MRLINQRPSRKAFLIILMLVSFYFTTNICAQETTVDGTALFTTLGVSATLNTTLSLECFLDEDPLFPVYFQSTAYLANIPALIFDTSDAWLNYGVLTGLETLYFANELFFNNNIASPVLFNFAHKYSMYMTYDSYTDIRSESSDPLYPPVDQYSFWDLATSPFDPSAYANWPTLGFVGSMLLITGIQMATSDSTNSIWNTGKTFIGDTEFPALAGISLMILLQVTNFTMTGIGEESLFRGVYYEELSTRYGEWPAKITDALYFTACHFPQNWENMTAQSWSTNLLNTGLSMLTAFWLQYLYEWYGLRTAIAAHTAIDVISFFGEWLLVGGSENSTGFSTNQNQNNLTISFPL